MSENIPIPIFVSLNFTMFVLGILTKETAEEILSKDLKDCDTEVFSKLRGMLTEKIKKGVYTKENKEHFYTEDQKTKAAEFLKMFDSIMGDTNVKH